MDPITRTLVFYSHALNSKDLGSEVVERAKYLLLDSVSYTHLTLPTIYSV